MQKNIAVWIIALSAHSMAFAADDMQQALSPVPQIEPGKIKHISIDKLSPSVKKMVQRDLQTDALAKQNRFGDIPDDAINYKKNYHANLKDLREIDKNMRFKIANLSSCELAKYRYEGAYPEGPTKTGPWSSLTKIFTRDDGVLVMLHEWDYAGDGGGVVMVDELMNVKVSGSPARFSVRRSPTGQVVSELIWATTRRYYTLTVMDNIENADAAKYNLKWLLALAGEVKPRN